MDNTTKTIEELHREAIERLEILDRAANHTRANLAYLDRGFRFVWVNDTYATQSGYPKSALIGQNHFHLFPDQENQAIFEEVRRSGIPFEIREKPFIYSGQPERGVTYWDWTLTPVESRDGGLPGLILSLVEVTDHVKARQEIERLRAESLRRELLSDTLNRVNIVIGVTLERDEILRRVIRESAGTVGSDSVGIGLREEGGWRIALFYRTVTEAFEPLDVLLTQAEAPVASLVAETQSPVAIADALTDSRVNLRLNRTYNIRAVLAVPLLVRHEVIGVLSYNWHSGPAALGKAEADFAEKLSASVSLALENARLYSDRKEAEARLQESHRILEALMEHIPEGITIADAPEATIRMVSRYGQELTGRPPLTLDVVPIQKDTDYWEIRPPGSLFKTDPDRWPLSRVVGQGEVITNEEWDLVRPNGETVPILCNAGPIRNREGRITGGIIAWRDIRAVKEAQSALEEAYRRDHRIARVLQQVLLPESPGRTAGLKVITRYQPALREADIGGDFYDLFDLGGGRVGVVIGDAAGKGLMAAIRAATARYAIRSYAYLNDSPGKVLASANEILCRDCPDGGSLMVTAFYAVVDTRTNTIRFANGGHEPPLLLSGAAYIQDIRVAGRALGVMEGFDYPEASRSLELGDRLILFTDGLTEARAGTQLFGRERILEFLTGHANLPADALATGLLKTATTFTGARLQDDAAIVTVEL